MAARQVHVLKVVGSNPAPATNQKKPSGTPGAFFVAIVPNTGGTFARCEILEGCDYPLL